MLNQEEKEIVQDAISKRTSREFVTPSGALIEYLRRILERPNLKLLVEVCEYYFESVPASRPFVKDKVPGLLVNIYYYNSMNQREYNCLMNFTYQNPSWATRIKESMISPEDFQNAVEHIKSEALRECDGVGHFYAVRIDLSQLIPNYMIEPEIEISNLLAKDGRPIYMKMLDENSLVFEVATFNFESQDAFSNYVKEKTKTKFPNLIVDNI